MAQWAIIAHYFPTVKTSWYVCTCNINFIVSTLISINIYTVVTSTQFIYMMINHHIWSYLRKCVRLHQYCGSMRVISPLKFSPQASTSHCRRDSLQSFLGHGVVGSMLKVSAAERTQRRREQSIYGLHYVPCFECYIWYSNWNETWQKWMYSWLFDVYSCIIYDL